MCIEDRLTESAEDDEGKGVADDPFTDGAENHEDAAKEEVGTYPYMIRISICHLFTLCNTKASTDQ